jgi:hypothetical protein
MKESVCRHTETSFAEFQDLGYIPCKILSFQPTGLLQIAKSNGVGDMEDATLLTAGDVYCRPKVSAHHAMKLRKCEGHSKYFIITVEWCDRTSKSAYLSLSLSLYIYIYMIMI